MRQLVTRYEVSEGHGWYVGSDAEIVLAPREPEVWPGMFEAYCRLRGREIQDFQFRSHEEEVEFLHDVGADGHGSGGSAIRSADRR